MAEPDGLHVRKSRDQRDHHFLDLILFPMGYCLLPLSKDILEVQLVLYVLTHNADSVSVVHCLIEEVTEKLDHIWVVLSLEQLHGFLLYNL